MENRSPSYLIHTPHGYHFRLRVPSDLRMQLGNKQEIRYSLKTGIWCLDINDDGDKRLKNAPSKRIIPLHPVLVNDLNFPGYVQSLKQRGEVRIFPELRKISHQYSHAASRWFNERYKKQIGLSTEDGQKKTYHSFRHTLHRSSIISFRAC